MKKTVIFGGTFNPPHIGHYEMLRYLQSREDIEKILIIPNKAPVHKVGFSLASGEDRLNMCEILAKSFPKASVWDIELKRESKSYTYLTVLDYYNSFGSIKPWVIIGADMLLTLKTWYSYSKLKKLCGFMAFFRKGESKEAFSEILEELRKDGADIEAPECDLLELSSTEVRSILMAGGSAEKLLKEEISDYIKEKLLYKGMREMNAEELKAHIKGKLSEKRYHHSLAVADEAVRLADRYGGDKAKAYLAGLLHDTLKDTPSNEQLKLAEEFGIILSDLEISAPKLYHSLIGCEYVRRILAIEDEEIISAIKYHTTAKADMSLLEKILYLADYTSLDRDYEGVEDMRIKVDEGLDIAMKAALDFTVWDLKAKNVPIHPNTLEAFRQYSK